MTIDPPRWLPASDAARYAHVVRHHVTPAQILARLPSWEDVDRRRRCVAGAR